MSRPHLFILLGPTASGKEQTALRCAEALQTEILSVDSMKIYTDLAIGTAKPTAAMQARVPHHCIDLAPPHERFNVAQYVEAAEAAIEKLATANRQPLLSGGTALYYKGLLEGLFEGPPADPAIRQSLQEQAGEEGADALFQRLQNVDPVTAGRVHPNDLRRIIRALEVHELTGRPISELQTQWNAEGAIPSASFDSGSSIPLRYPVSIAALDWPRELLYKRIEARVDRMMDEGLLKEARWVYTRREFLARTPLQAVGYKEFFPHFEGQVGLMESVELLKRNTRHLAKSQMTWFRKFPCHWIPMEEGMTPEQTGEQVLAVWTGKSTPKR